MNSKILGIVVAAAAGIIGMVLVGYSDNAVYSINSECELYSSYINTLDNSESLGDANMEYVGYTSSDIQKITQQAQEKYYGSENKNTLSNNVDQSEYQQYIDELSFEMFTEKTIANNHINPDLKESVREMLEIINSKDTDSLRSKMSTC